MPDQKNISSTSQDFLDIYDIINDVVILKNGSSSVVLTVNAMNFGLLAEQEQDSVIYSYAGLLNSINYPIQILIQSQTKDASAYLKLLDERELKTKDELKKAWIRRYSKFVSDLIKERNVLDKKFFVVIPASSLEMGLTLGQDIVSGFKEQTIEGVEKSVILEKAKTLLDPKRDHMIAQFNRIGLYARQLSTEEIIRLFYTNYNPEASEGQQITNSENYTTALVQAQIRGNYMNDQSPNPLQSTPVTDETAAAPETDVSPTTPVAQTPALATDSAGSMAPITPVADQSLPTATAPLGVMTPPKTETISEDLGSEEVNISESPILQKPTPATIAPSPTSVQPPTATPVVQAMPVIDAALPMTQPTVTPTPKVDLNTAGTIEITKPEPATAPINPSLTTPTMPEPTKMPGVSNPALSTDITQENINQTINQITDKPTQ